MADSHDTSYEMTANQRDMGGCAMFFAYLIIIAVVIYADVMFIKVMWASLPDGFLKVLSIGGAVTTGASVIVLVVGKSYWFRPGYQMLAAWLFTGVEVIVSALNTIVAYQMPNVVSPLTYWLYVLPATPFIALCGWVLIIHLDRSTTVRHKALEMNDKLAIAQMQYQHAVGMARVNVMNAELTQVISGLQQAMSSPQAQARIAHHANTLLDNILTEVTGHSSLSALNAPVIDSTLAPASLSQTATLPPAPEPTSPPIQPAAAPPVEDDASKKAPGDSGTTGTSSEKSSTSEQAPASNPPTSKPVKTPRKRGRSSTRDEYVDDVVLFEATGNVSAKWAHLDDFKRYMSENPPTAEEKEAARKRCGL